MEHRATLACLTAVVALMLACVSVTPGTALANDRKREVVRYADVAIEVIQEGHGPLIVLLPSLGRDSEELDLIAEDLATAGFRVIRPRPRGFGQSTGPMQGITLHDFARDDAEAIQHEQAGPAIVVGHAFGHFVARATATDYPDLVRAVVLLGASQKKFNGDGVTNGIEVCEDFNTLSCGTARLINDSCFTPGNVPLLENVGDAGFLISGMSGGQAGNCLAATGCNVDNDCASNHCQDHQCN